MRSQGQPLFIVGRSLLSILAVGLVTFLATTTVNVNASTVGFAYLLLVLLIASTCGFIEAAMASVTATLTYNYFFLPPVGTLTIADPQNWVALFSFLGSSLIVSRLSAKAERRALDAIEHQQDIERLYSFSRSILLSESNQPVPKQLVSHLAESFKLSSVVLYERRTGLFYYAGPQDLAGVETSLRETALRGTSHIDPLKSLVISSVRLGTEPIASLALGGANVSDSVLQNIANLIAISLERARVQEMAMRAEAARQTEQLRTTLIDAMAHEFKTPLTSIKAVTTALLSSPESNSRERLDILKIADEEADRLKELVDETVEMSRLESNRVSLDLEPANIQELIVEVKQSLLAALEDRPLEIISPSAVPSIPLDRRLMKIALRQLLDNARKYSPPRSLIRIKVEPSEQILTIQIINTGEGIAEEEQGRIFERFYRSPSVIQQVPGLGLGLSIAERIVQEHQGSLTLESHPGETTFRISIPLTASRPKR
jgi:two-component system, OmpR family, sensor histidine kinase KdpD